jgi:hypothetical protein
MQNADITNDILKGLASIFLFFSAETDNFILTTLILTWLAAHQFDTQLISVYKSK